LPSPNLVCAAEGCAGALLNKSVTLSAAAVACAPSCALQCSACAAVEAAAVEKAAAEEAAALLAFTLESVAAMRAVDSCRLLRWEAVAAAVLFTRCTALRRPFCATKASAACCNPRTSAHQVQKACQSQPSCSPRPCHGETSRICGTPLGRDRHPPSLVLPLGLQHWALPAQSTWHCLCTPPWVQEEHPPSRSAAVGQRQALLEKAHFAGTQC
jgi:hypothetical protein